MWPKNQAYQDDLVEMSIPSGVARYPPNEQHLIDMVGTYPTEAVHRFGSWPRTYAPSIQEVALRFDGILSELTQHLHENNRGATTSNICLVSALLEKDILDIPVPITDNNRSYMLAYLSSGVASMAELLNPVKAGYVGSPKFTNNIHETKHRFGRWVSRQEAATLAVEHIQDLTKTEARVSHHVPPALAEL